MPRPPRIEYEGAWYHVMNRGANHCKIFLGPNYYQVFLNLLAEVSFLYEAEIYCYCLMDNHYHLLVHTPKGNLSQIMKYLDGVYVKRFNKIAGRDGPLFRGRYKAKLVETNEYLLGVSRYIHLNPVSEDNLAAAGKYEWSSYSAYIGKSEAPIWLFTDKILEQFRNQDSYRDFVEVSDTDKKCVVSDTGRFT